MEDRGYQSGARSMLGDHSSESVPCQIGSSIDPVTTMDPMHTSAGRMSTSRSLMGNYESIHLDFGASGTGLGINANPFGNPSQQSNTSGDHGGEYENLRSIFQPGLDFTADVAPSPIHGGLDRAVDPNTDTAAKVSLPAPSHMQHMLGGSKSCVDPAFLVKNVEGDVHGSHGSTTTSSRKRRKTDNGLPVAVPSGVETAITHDHSPLAIEKQAKKRGRKPKNSAISPGDDLEHEAGVYDESQEFLSPVKDASSAKDSSTNRHVDEEFGIGLPKELYKPRPSRSRSKNISKEQTPEMVGDPPDSLQIPPQEPQMVKPDDNNITQPELSEHQDQTSPAKPKKEKRKKNKMKRAKTSAAALLRKSDSMLSDGEEDVVWVESRPAAVKMKVPDPVASKIKGEADDDDYDDDDDREGKDEPHRCTRREAAAAAVEIGAVIKEAPTSRDMKNAGNAADAVSVQIPPPAEGKPSVQSDQPKKRGRKKKGEVSSNTTATTAASTKKTFIQDSEDDEPFDTAAEPPKGEVSGTIGSIAGPTTASIPETESALELETSRHPLQEKDINISQQQRIKETNPTTTAATPSPSKHPTNLATATPARGSTSQYEKGPTKHSPINPSGGAVQYRVGLSRRATIQPLLKIVRK